MTPKFDRYAGLQAAKTKNIDKFSPAEWAAYFSKIPDHVFKKVHNQLCRRGGPEWQRVKDLCMAEMMRRQESQSFHESP